MKKINYGIVASLSGLLYLFFAFHSLHKMPLGDEIYQVAVIDVHDDYHAPQNIKNFGLWGHPTLYGETLLSLAKIFKPDYVTARIFGMCLVLALLVVMGMLAHEIFPDRKAAERIALLSIFIYSTHPMVIQGSLLLDRDNTFFTLFLSLFLLFFIRDRKKGGTKGFVLCVLVLTLLMWGKLTPLPVVAFSLFVFEALSRRDRLLRDLMILVLSAALFTASWFVYCAYVPREGVVAKDVFLYFLKSAGTRYRPSSAGFHSVVDIVRTSFYLILWMNPFFLACACFYGARSVKTVFRDGKLRDEDIFTVFSSVIFFAFILYGRIMFGFPKYHYPMLFMFSMMVAGSLISIVAEEKPQNILLYGILCFISYLAYAAFLDDIYRTAYFDVKQSFIHSGAVSHSLKEKMAAQVLFLSFSFIGVAAVIGRFAAKNNVRAVVLSLFIGGLALNFSQNTFQLQPDYSTVSGYGETGTSAVLDYARGRLVKGRFVFSSQQIMFYLKQLKERYHPDAFYNDPRNILKELQDEKIQFFIYGVNSHTLQQITHVFNSPAIHDFLRKNFLMKKIGTYIVWERKRL